MHWVLEDDIDEIWVINARHMRNVPGRKTDVGDAQWGAQLLEHGLVRPSFIPERKTRPCSWVAATPGVAFRSPAQHKDRADDQRLRPDEHLGRRR